MNQRKGIKEIGIVFFMMMIFHLNSTSQINFSTQSSYKYLKGNVAQSLDGFNVNAGLRIRGGYSRNDGFPKRGFRLFLKSEYGNSKLN